MIGGYEMAIFMQAGLRPGYSLICYSLLGLESVGFGKASTSPSMTDNQ
jgi:hypothetical protein